MGDMADLLFRSCDPFDYHYREDWPTSYFPYSARISKPTCNRCGKRIWWYQVVVGNKLVWRPHNQTGSRMHVCRIDPKKEFDNLDALDKDGVQPTIR